VLAAGTFAGWVDNAAVLRDASLHQLPARDVLNLIALNLNPAVIGCATAIRRFLAAGTGGAIVNVSSHQAQRAVRGALPYMTAKAAVEGLTRALAVDYCPRGVRVNAVALGSISTERYAAIDHRPLEGNRHVGSSRAARSRRAALLGVGAWRPGGRVTSGAPATSIGRDRAIETRQIPVVSQGSTSRLR
jgi:NAD(P)-dependent dehydrogenase (short-subunit alcohol dehydrogenase family)